MKTRTLKQTCSGFVLIAALVSCFGLAQVSPALAQCTEVTSGLHLPLGTTLTNHGNLLVSESGTGAMDGRISIFDSSGNRRTLLDGLPSGINDVGDPSGPAGIAIRGRNLYVAIGTGDVGRAGPCRDRTDLIQMAHLRRSLARF